MIYTAASLYRRRKPKVRINVDIDDSWSLLKAFRTIVAVFFDKKSKVNRYVLSAKIIPLNRFNMVRKINKYLLYFVLQKVITKYPLFILWINNPEFYPIHNESKFSYLVFSCDKSILSDSDRFISYRECYEEGWVFVYTLTNSPKVRIFKNESQEVVVSEIRKISEY